MNDPNGTSSTSRVESKAGSVIISILDGGSEAYEHLLQMLVVGGPVHHCSRRDRRDEQNEKKLIDVRLEAKTSGAYSPLENNNHHSKLTQRKLFQAVILCLH